MIETQVLMEQFNETSRDGMTGCMEVTAALLIVTAIQHLTVHKNQIVLAFVALDAHAGGLSALIVVGTGAAIIMMFIAVLMELTLYSAG